MKLWIDCLNNCFDVYIEMVKLNIAPLVSIVAKNSTKLLVLYKVKLRNMVSPKGSQAQYGARRKCVVCINTVTITLSIP